LTFPSLSTLLGVVVRAEQQPYEDGLDEPPEGEFLRGTDRRPHDEVSPEGADRPHRGRRDVDPEAPTADARCHPGQPQQLGGQ